MKEDLIFKLYRIVDKETGLAFTSQRNNSFGYCGRTEDGLPNPYFTKDGALFKKLDTIKKHLRYLTTKYSEKVQYQAGALTWYSWKGPSEIIARRNRYEVEVFEVLKLSKVVIQASDLLRRKETV